MKYKDISKFPEVSKDLAVVVDKSVLAKYIEAVIKKSSNSLLTGIKIFYVYEGANLGENKKSIGFSLAFRAPDRTLTDEEINGEIDVIINNLQNALSAEIRK